MGLTARHIDDLTIWEFRCMASGFRKFNGGESSKAKPPSSEDFAEAMQTMGDLI